jgi:hypothetical protein
MPGDEPESACRSPSASASRPIASAAPESAGEVVDPEERRLALARPAALELVQHAEELEERPDRRRGAPRGDDDEQRH